MTTLTFKIPEKKAKLAKQLLKELGAVAVTETKRTKESLYDPEFVAKIRQGEKDIKNGKGIKIDINELWK